jgi:hypothetical protein
MEQDAESKNPERNGIPDSGRSHSLSSLTTTSHLLPPLTFSIIHFRTHETHGRCWEDSSRIPVPMSPFVNIPHMHPRCPSAWLTQIITQLTSRHGVNHIFPAKIFIRASFPTMLSLQVLNMQTRDFSPPRSSSRPFFFIALMTRLIPLILLLISFTQRHCSSICGLLYAK